MANKPNSGKEEVSKTTATGPNTSGTSNKPSTKAAATGTKDKGTTKNPKTTASKAKSAKSKTAAKGKTTTKGKQAASSKETPRKKKPVNYGPKDIYTPPRVGTKAEKVIALLKRPSGATDADIQKLLNENGGRNGTPVDEDYARTWVAQSYLQANYGLGIKTTERKDGSLVYHAVIPQKTKEAKPAKSKGGKAAQPTT